MKYLTLIVVSCAIISNIYAQETRPQFLTIEGVGNAKHLSVNYDSRFAPGMGGFGFRAGLGGTWSHYGRDNVSVNIPVGINYLIGSDKHFGEIGFVAVPEYYFGTSSKEMFFSTNANIGYRYISENGIMLNALFTPLITRDKLSSNFKSKHPWFGLGVGIKL